MVVRRPVRIARRKSRIAGFGVYALEPIARTRASSYDGEISTAKASVAKRQCLVDASGASPRRADGRRRLGRRNIARFINHAAVRIAMCRFSTA
jgi:SET domain-containing protein